MKLNLSLIFGLSMAAGSAFAECPGKGEPSGPLPVESSDPECMQVTGARIPNWQPGTMFAFGGPGPAPVVYGPKTLAETNAQGQKKAQKAKTESDQGVSLFWANPVYWLLSKINSFEVVNKPKLKIHVDPNGGWDFEASNCTDIAVNTENSKTCGELERTVLPDGKIQYEFHKLIAVKMGNKIRLVYSTDDTIRLIGNTDEEIFAMLRAVDPNIPEFH